MNCFGCMANTKANHERRRPCVERGSHRPKGPIVDHDHVPFAVRACRDCGTLVVG